MSELEQRLHDLAADLVWPTTPDFGLPARRSRAAPLVLAFATALVVAFAVPQARTAILRAFHLGGVTVQHVSVLPRAQHRPLTALLGARVDRTTARAVLGAPVRLPKQIGAPALYLRDGVVSAVLPGSVLLSELNGPAAVLKKVASTSTAIEPVTVGGAPGLWITGAAHVVFFPKAPARYAGNVLIWQRGSLVYRLEGRGLGREEALRIAAGIDGTS